MKAHNRIVLITSGNRAGKTVGLQLKHLYYCMYKIGLEDLLEEDPHKWLNTRYLTLNGSFEYNTAQKVFDNLRELARVNPAFKEGGAFIKRISEKERRVVFTNGSEFHFASLEEMGKHIEGEAYRLITVDEAGYVQHLEKIYKTVLQARTLGVGGITVFCGTPKEITDPWLEEVWQLSKERDNISYMRTSTYENTYLDVEELKALEEDYKDYPAEKEMVFYGRFVPRSSRSLTSSQIDNAVDDSLPNDPRDKNGKPTKKTPYMFGTSEKVEGHKHVTFWDIAMQADWSVGITLDVSSIPFEVRNFTRVNRSIIKGWNELFDLMRKEHERYGSVQHYDSTGQIGGRLQEDFRKIGFENGFKSSWAKPMMIISDKGPKKQGKIGKEELINYLTLAFAFREPVEDESKVKWGKVRIPNIRQLVKELGHYHPDDKKIKDTDSVIALAGCLAVAPDPGRNKPRSGYFTDINPLVESARSYFRL